MTSTLSVAQNLKQKQVKKTSWQSLYQPTEFDGMPIRMMPPIQIEAGKKYPLILSLHGAGGTGSKNNKQLKDWNKQLAVAQRRKEFPCYVVAPQARGLWNSEHLKKIQSYINTLSSVDMDRVYIMGHSMGGHGTYIFIQLAPDYFAAAAPSAGSGLRRTEEFIDAAKIDRALQSASRCHNGAVFSWNRTSKSSSVMAHTPSSPVSRKRESSS